MQQNKKKNEDRSIFLEDFSFRLRKSREDKGLSMSELAKILGFSSSSQISRYETGLNIPDAYTLYKIAKILNVDLNWLIIGLQSPINETMRTNYSRALSLLHTQLFFGIQHQIDTIENFTKIVDNIERKQKAGEELTDAEKVDLQFHKAHIPFQQTILNQFMEDQAWAAKAMNDALSKNNTGQNK